MKVMLAPDAFKDSLSAEKVAKAMERGVLKFNANAACKTLFASDGGEGFLESVQRYVDGLERVFVKTIDPLFRPIETYYVWDKTTRTAYVELAKASGIELLKDDERNALETTTEGTGLLFLDAINKGAEAIYLGIGGSATNDGGIGIAKVLGYHFLDDNAVELKAIGGNLQKISRIERPDSIPPIKFYAINDVLNPLHGPKGAAHTYAKQKGASPDQIKYLDDGLKRLDTIVQKDLHKLEATTPGSGAAGGTAYGLKCFLDATYISGTQFILGLANFKNMALENEIELIITGEGKIDFQTAYGKFVHGIIQEANQLSIPVLAVCGKLDLDEDGVKELGLLDAAQLYDPNYSISYSFENAEKLVEDRVLTLLEKHF